MKKPVELYKPTRPIEPKPFLKIDKISIRLSSRQDGTYNLLDLLKEEYSGFNANDLSKITIDVFKDYEEISLHYNFINTISVDNPRYDIQRKNYELAFKRYQRDLEKYEKDINKYNEYMAERDKKSRLALYKKLKKEFDAE